MKPEKKNIRGVYFDNVTLDEADALLDECFEAGEQTAVFTPNSEIVQCCIDKPEMYEIINSAELIVPDGIGVIKAAKILGTPLKCKVAGVELGERVVKKAHDHGRKLFFLGGKPGIAEAAAAKLAEKYGDLTVVGTNDGYFTKTGEENDAVIEKINASCAEVLFVCLGAPAQENWIFANRSRLPGVKIMLGLGGSLDVYSDTVKRAPKVFVKLGLEWFYRLIKEPKRIGRMMSLPKFYFGTILYKLGRK